MIETSLFPILKDSVRIKKLRAFCWLTELYTDLNKAIAPPEALLLALCTGEYDIETILYIFAGIYKLETDSVHDFILEHLEENRDCLDFSPRPSVHSLRYRPVEFLYDALPTQEIRPRCEIPTEMLLSLTHRCNFRCIYCFNAAGKGLSDELDTGEWLNVIQQAKALGVMHCTLTGGEPLLHPGFFKILEAVMHNDMLTTVCTNGSRLDDRTVSRMKELKLPLVQVSLDASDAELCDRMTAALGSFKRITTAIERLVAAGIPVYIKAVLTPLNAAQAGGLVDLCARLGVSQLVLDRYDVSSSGRGGTELLIGKSDERLVKNAVSERIEANGGKLRVKLISYSRKWENGDDIIPCGAFRRSFNVLPDGEISACEKLVGVPGMSAGNVRDTFIRDIWNSDRVSTIIEPPPTKIDEACQKCEFYKKCGAGCYAIKYFLGENPFGVDPRCFCAQYENNPYSNL